jgi:hypothetical protein
MGRRAVRDVLEKRNLLRTGIGTPDCPGRRLLAVPARHPAYPCRQVGVLLNAKTLGPHAGWPVNGSALPGFDLTRAVRFLCSPPLIHSGCLAYR